MFLERNSDVFSHQVKFWAWNALGALPPCSPTHHPPSCSTGPAERLARVHRKLTSRSARVTQTYHKHKELGCRRWKKIWLKMQHTHKKKKKPTNKKTHTESQFLCSLHLNLSRESLSNKQEHEKLCICCPKCVGIALLLAATAKKQWSSLFPLFLFQRWQLLQIKFKNPVAFH